MSLQPERLQATHLLAIFDEIAALPKDQATVEAGLTRFIASGPPWSQKDASFCLMAAVRTAGIFVLSPADVVAAADAILCDPPSELPRLPFPRMFIEFRDGDGDSATIIREDVYGPDGKLIGHPALNACSVFDHPNGWLISAFTADVEPNDGATGEFVMGIVTLQDVVDGTWFGSIAAGCVTAIDLVAPRLAPAVIARPLRRSYERRFRRTPPTIYEVKLAGYGDQHPGHGDRQYHCRWVVRGHWRYHQNGQRSWVRPYVKGPVDAPWRGRPVYTALEGQAA